VDDVAEIRRRLVYFILLRRGMRWFMYYFFCFIFPGHKLWLFFLRQLGILPSFLVEPPFSDSQLFRDQSLLRGRRKKIDGSVVLFRIDIN
jgi:hypothetical protein